MYLKIQKILLSNPNADWAELEKAGYVAISEISNEILEVKLPS
jgi:hypothetical protein